MPELLPGEAATLGRLMLAFRGATVPVWLRRRLAEAPAAGVSLFRVQNIRNPRQVRVLTRALQAAAAGSATAAGGSAHVASPLLIAVDQEGGQLNALGEPWTQFPGAMALGATSDADLAERVGYAVGRELRAVGINVAFGPVLDVVATRDSPALGVRAFGDDPELVGRLGAATIRGLQRAGVAATAKHFPGIGRVATDTHHALGVVEATRRELDGSELRPFAAAIDTGVKLVMSGHFAVPALTGSRQLPATLARAVMGDLLRHELGFRGASITDALDMAALPQDATQAVDVVAALDAGVDLLLTMHDRRATARIEAAVRRAAEVGLLDSVRDGSVERIEALRRWIGGFEAPPLDVVGSAAHRALAAEVAARSLTLVRDAGLLPLRLDSSARLLAVMPRPKDLTPADTSSYVQPHLAAALRAHHGNVDEIVTGHPPTDAEVRSVVARAGQADVIVIGTINAGIGSTQAELVTALAATGKPVVSVAMRTPWDVLSYPSVATNIATYSILPVSLEALAAALFGRGAAGVDSSRSAAAAFPGRLPVAL